MLRCICTYVCMLILLYICMCVMYIHLHLNKHTILCVCMCVHTVHRLHTYKHTYMQSAFTIYNTPFI